MKLTIKPKDFIEFPQDWIDSLKIWEKEFLLFALKSQLMFNADKVNTEQVMLFIAQIEENLT
jgi:CRISPR/Cas system-associated protein endoribonuclease Cas2